MRDVTALPKAVDCDRVGGCDGRPQVKPEPVDPRLHGSSGNQKITCDRMWPETCYVCDEKWRGSDLTSCKVIPRHQDPLCDRERHGTGCEAKPIKDPLQIKHEKIEQCKRDRMVPGMTYSLLTLGQISHECEEKYKDDGKEKKQVPSGKNKSEAAPIEGHSTWQSSFNRFSENFVGYESEDAVADGEAINDKEQTQDVEGSATDKPKKLDKSESNSHPGEAARSAGNPNFGTAEDLAIKNNRKDLGTAQENHEAVLERLEADRVRIVFEQKKAKEKE